MGKAILVALAAIIIASTTLYASRLNAVNDTVRTTSKHQLKVLARNAALAGYEQAKQELANAGSLQPFATSPVTLTGDFQGAPYATTISVSDGLATISSTAEMSNALDEASHQIEALISTSSSAAAVVPPFLKYALISEDDLLLNGNVKGTVADPSQPLNGNWHTNGDLRINGNKNSVAGFGTYVGSATANPSKALQGTFKPNYNPDNAETAFRTSRVEIPEFDSSVFFESITPNETSYGDVRLNAQSINKGGTRENPYIWHIRGDFTANGNLNIDGYLMIVVEGNVILNGSVDAASAGDESSVAFYAGGNVTLNGNVGVAGQIYADGRVTFNGTPDVYGSVATNSNVVLNGNPVIHYRPAAPSLSSIFSEKSELVLVSYFEN